MPEILSQDEIDALLSAIESGDLKTEEIKEETKHRKIKIYDFKRPDFITREERDELLAAYPLFELDLLNESRRLELYPKLSSLELVGDYEITFDEFIRSINNPAYALQFKIGKEGGKQEFGCIEVDRRLFAPLSPLYFLNEEAALKDAGQEKAAEFTEFSKKFAELFIRHCFPMQEITFGDLVTDPYFLRYNHNKDEMIFLVTCELKFKHNHRSCADYFDKLFSDQTANTATIDALLADVIKLGDLFKEEDKMNLELVKAFRTNWSDIKGVYNNLDEVTRLLLEQMDKEVFTFRTESSENELDDGGKSRLITKKISSLIGEINNHIAKDEMYDELVNLCLPIGLVQRRFKKQDENLDSIRNIRDCALENIPVKLEVELGRKDVPLDYLKEIETGDIIELDRKAGQEFDVFANTMYIGKCLIAVENNQYLVKFSGFSSENKQPEFNIYEKLPATVNLRAVLGHAYISLEDLRNLMYEKRQVLDELVGRSIPVKSGNDVLFRGEVVVVDENFGIRVTSREHDYFKEPEKDEEKKGYDVPFRRDDQPAQTRTRKDEELSSIKEQITTAVSELRPLLRQFKELLTSPNRKGSGTSRGKTDESAKGPFGIPLTDAGEELGDDYFGSDENLQSLLAQFADDDLGGAAEAEKQGDKQPTRVSFCPFGDIHPTDEEEMHERSDEDLQSLLKQFADGGKKDAAEAGRQDSGDDESARGRPFGVPLVDDENKLGADEEHEVPDQEDLQSLLKQFAETSKKKPEDKSKILGEDQTDHAA